MSNKTFCITNAFFIAGLAIFTKSKGDDAAFLLTLASIWLAAAMIIREIEKGRK